MDISILIHFIFLLLISFAAKINGNKKTCFSTNVTYALCVMNDTIPTVVSETFTGDSFHEECHPHFVEEVLGEPCEGEQEKPTTDKDVPTTAQRYGYGFLAVFVISTCSLVGLLAFPCIYKVAFQYVLALFTALAVGTLLGDAIFHLIPFILGLHNHKSEDENGHEHDGEKHSSMTVPDYQWRLLAAVMTLYAFYLLEVFLHWVGYVSRNKNSVQSHGHSHDHAIQLGNIPKNDSISNNTSINIDDNNPEPDQALGKHVHHSNYNEIDPTSACVDGNCSQRDHMPPITKTKNIDNPNETKDEPGKTTEVTGWMVLIGDGIHNFADGLAIGAAFSQNLILGLTTTIAIGCHELPHEFGDYAVLIQSGFSHCRALFWNFISATSAVVGFFIGAAASTDETARQWIFAVTVGMFLYIGLVDLLPTLLPEGCIQLKRFVCVNIGFLVGITIMFVLAIFEDKLIEVGQ